MLRESDLWLPVGMVEDGISIVKSRGIYLRHQWGRFLGSIRIQAREVIILRLCMAVLLQRLFDLKHCRFEVSTFPSPPRHTST